VTGLSRVWYCRTCGYEVNSGGRCHSCGERLIESALSELREGEAIDEVGYRLNAWEDEQRGQLIEALNEVGIRHRFEVDELVVDSSDEAAVDAIVEACGATAEDAGPDQAAADDGPLPGAAQSPSPEDLAIVDALYDAAWRLKADPTDMVADRDLAAASVQVFGIDRFYGVDTATWAAIGRVTRRLLMALSAEEALEDEIRDSAAILCRIAEPLVAPESTDAEDAGLAPIASMWPSPASPPAAGGTEGAGSEEAGGAGGGADEREQLVYELVGWLPEQRAWLSVLLQRDGIPHEWEGEDLVVPAAFGDRAEELFDRVEREGHAAPSPAPADAAWSDELEPSEESGEEDEALYKAICELFAAADRVAGDPEDISKCAELVHATLNVADSPVPFGMTDVQWWQVRARAKSVAESIALHADEDVVRSGATSLRDLLRGFV
jgi:hypothetical protein